jgi:hypothetical protein
MVTSTLFAALTAAVRLMEHREQWLLRGLRSAETTVGMEFDRARANEVQSAHEMGAKVVALVAVLRVILNRAENDSLRWEE